MTENYYFEDFTRENYRKLIRLTKKNHRFVNYGETDTNDIVVWRHDIDISVHAASKLAQIENEENVISTNFVWLHSTAYHFWEKEVVKLFKDMINLGHKFGLHFDHSFYSINSFKELEAKLIYEKKVLENVLGTEINVFSYHNPTSEILQHDNLTIGGMINTYSSFFKGEFSYCSDSNGYWRHSRLENVLRDNHKKLHVLTHPGWWQETPMVPRERVKRCLYGRAKRNMLEYDKYLNENNRLNIR